MASRPQISTVLALKVLGHFMIRHGHLPRLALPGQPVVDNAFYRSDLIDRFMVADQLYRSVVTVGAFFVFLVFDPSDLQMGNEPARGTEHSSDD